jgi:hypothetical protein
VFVKGGAGIDICGGVVSSKSGSFWCTKGMECTTASHGTKMSLAQNYVYIRATATVQKAEFEHTLDATKSEAIWMTVWFTNAVLSNGDLSSRLRRNVPTMLTVTGVLIFGWK